MFSLSRDLFISNLIGHEIPGFMWKRLHHQGPQCCYTRKFGETYDQPYRLKKFIAKLAKSKLEDTSCVGFSNNNKYLFTALRSTGLSIMDLNSQSQRHLQTYHSGNTSLSQPSLTSV